MLKKILLILFSSTSLVFAQSPQIPQNIDWDKAGVPNDFPAQFDNVFNVGSPGSLSGNHADEIQSVLDQAGAISGTNLVLLSSGVYSINKPIRFESGEHDNVYLKGVGTDDLMNGGNSTILELDFSDPENFNVPDVYNDPNGAIIFWGGWDYTVGTVSSYNSTYNRLRINNVNDVNVGDLLRIRSTNSSKYMGQVNEVKSIISTNPLVVELAHDFSLSWDQKSEYNVSTLEVHKYNSIKNAGVSSLSLKTVAYPNANYISEIDVMTSNECWNTYGNAPSGYHIIIYRGKGIHITNIYSYRPLNSHIRMIETLQNSITDSFFDNAIFRHGCAGGHGYGISPGRHNTLNLVENNIFRHLRRALPFSKGDHKNVYAYNYSRETESQSGNQNFRGDLSSRNWFDSGNLAEGNRIDRITNDIFHGATYTQYKNTYFRNYTYYHEIINRGGIETYFLSNQAEFNSDETDFSSIATDYYGLWDFGFGPPQTVAHSISSTGYSNPNIKYSTPSLYYNQKPEFMNQNDSWNQSYTWPAIGARLSYNGLELTQDIPARGRYCEVYDNYTDPDYWCEGGSSQNRINNETAFTESSEKVNLSNYPNPFNPSTVIKFNLKAKSHIRLEVFDMVGRKVATLVDEVKLAKNHEVDFNAKNLPSGVYIYRLIGDDFSQIKKMLLVK
ncbi:T9SS type A sorting domain-containing protein [Gracilimonas sp.]|uniref:T9SS type A sorting domain-containing protein n=1 Tax=Gracilimonas sp. TaxID=1974203 RepID=UPI003D0959E8